MSIADKLITIADNTPAVVEAVDSKRSLANGSIIHVNDVYSIEHDLAVRVENKNLFNVALNAASDNSMNTSYDADVITTNFINGGLFVNRGKKAKYPAGTYTLSVIPLSENFACVAYVYKTSDGSTINAKNIGETWNYNFTFTADTEFYLCLGGLSGYYGERFYKVQLEKGTVATEYTPYTEDSTEGVEVSRHGKNLFAYGRFISYGNSFNSTWGSVGNHLGEECFIYKNKYPSTVTTDFTFMKGEFLENTQYTITLEATYAYNSTTEYSMPILAVVYTDGVTAGIQTKLNSTKYTKLRLTTAANKTVSHIFLQNFSSGCTVYVKTNAQIEVGTVPTAYEPYVEQTETANAEGIVKGLTSISPNMTLKSNTDGISISCKYFSEENSATYEKYKQLNESFEGAIALINELTT